MRLVLVGLLICVLAVIGGGSGILRRALNGGGNDEKLDVSKVEVFCFPLPRRDSRSSSLTVRLPFGGVGSGDLELDEEGATVGLISKAFCWCFLGMGETPSEK